MWIYIYNLDQVIWLAENQKWAWHLNLFSMTRVKTLSVHLIAQTNSIHPKMQNKQMKHQKNTRIPHSQSTALPWHQQKERWGTNNDKTNATYEWIKMPHPLIIVSQSDCMIQVGGINSHTEWQTVQIQIGWLLQKPTDLDLHCLLRQGMSCSAREGLNWFYSWET